MHLTPTRSDIRARLFRLWERELPSTHTKDWQRDWRVYRWIEIVRSAYVDLDRLVTGESLDAPNVRRAIDSYAMTLKAATASLGLPVRRWSGSEAVWAREGLRFAGAVQRPSEPARRFPEPPFPSPPALPRLP
jgi:hypothetical protein